MKTTYILLIVSLVCLNQTSLAHEYTWLGNDTVFARSGNWSSSTGVTYPGSGDTAIIVSATNRPVLASNHDVARLVVASGSFDLKGYTFTSTGSGGFSAGTIDNGTLIIRGTKAEFAGTTFNVMVDTQSDIIELSGGIFNEICIFTTTGQENSLGNGGCVFNDDVTIVHTGNNRKAFRMQKVSGDQFNGTLVLINMSNGQLTLADEDTTVFNGDVELNNMNTGLIYIGYGGGYSELTTGYTISIGDSGFFSGELYFKGFAQKGSTAQTLTLTDSSSLYLKGCIWEGNVTLTAPDILCSYAQFNGITQITKTRTSGNYWFGENNFNGTTTITYQGTAGSTGDELRLADSNPNVYNENVSFESSGNPIEVVANSSSEFHKNVSTNKTAVTFLSGAVFFKGNQIQELNGTVSFDFEIVEINKTAEHVILNTDVDIYRSVEFTNGNIISDSINIITFLAGSEANGAHNGSFVSGPVKKVGDTEFEFPVGDIDAFLPISISAPLSATDAFSAQCFVSRHTLGESKDTALQYISECNYWNLTRTTGTSKVKGKFYWDYASCGIVDSAKLRIANWDGSNWDDLGISAFNGNYTSGNILPNDSLSQFGYFALAYNLLPIPSDNSSIYVKGSGFMENIGQLVGTDTLRHNEVKFYSKFDDKDWMLQDTIFSYQFYKFDAAGIYDSLFRMDMRLHGAYANTTKTLRDSSGGYNHFYTDTITNWYDSVYTWYSLTYKNVYDSIDMKFRSDVKGFDFIVRPGGVPTKIRYSFIGADTVIKYFNDLTASCRFGEVNFNVLEAYQVVGGTKTLVSISYTLSSGQITYSIGAYDTTKNLIISAYKLTAINPNPLAPGYVYWATFLGNKGSDIFTNITTDDTNNDIYVVGRTNSPKYISTPGSFQQFYSNFFMDALVVSFNADRGKQWATYCGGTGWDEGNAIAFENNSVYFGGTTSSNSGFPLCMPCGVSFSALPPGGTGQDFIVKLTAAGLMNISTGFSTFFGGTAYEGLHAMVGDGHGNVYFGGRTADINTSFPLQANGSAYYRDLSGGIGWDDCYIAKIDNSNNLDWCTTFGGGSAQTMDCEEINSMAVDAGGNLFITGTTCSGGLPTPIAGPVSSSNVAYFPLVYPTLSAYIADNANGNINNSSDAFIAKFNTSDQLLWSTEFGGEGTEVLYQDFHNYKGIAINSVGDPYIIGTTNSAANFDFENYGTYNQTSLAGGWDAYMVYFKAYTLVWSTLYGGQGDDIGMSVEVDQNNDVYFTGFTNSNNSAPAFPLLQAANSYYQGKLNKNNIAGKTDLFLTKFSDVGNHNWSTYYGGKQYDFGYAAAVIKNSDFDFISIGTTNSGNFGTYDILGNLDYYDANLNLTPNTTDAFIINLQQVCFGCLREAAIVEENNIISESINTEYNDLSYFTVYPNPITDNINISLDQKESNVNIEIIDMVGNLILHFDNVEVSGNHYRIDLQSLKAGVYFIRLINKNNAYLNKFIKN